MQSLVENIDHLTRNMENLLSYVHENYTKNIFLRERWQEICHKVIHGVILTESLRKLANDLNNNKVEEDNLSLLLARMLSFCTLLIWEIYDLLYTYWLKYLLEPSIMHKGIYTTVTEHKELKKQPIFVEPMKIDEDTHEIARRVARNATQFDSYKTYTLFGMLADAKMLIYVARRSKDEYRYVVIEKEKIDTAKEIDFMKLGKAVEVLAIWRNQFAHFGDYLLASNEIFKSLQLDKKSLPQFDQFKSKISSEFSLRSLQSIKYLDRLFWRIGDAVKILNDSCKNIEKIFNYQGAP
jgi:hypothetical protein